MKSTLLLDRTPWDLCVDAVGNIALASPTYSVLQDVASAARLFLGELYYGPATKGVPYFSEILGQSAPTAILRTKLADAAKSVEGVTDAQVFLTKAAGRAISGQIQVTLATGGTQTVNF